MTKIIGMPQQKQIIPNIIVEFEGCIHHGDVRKIGAPTSFANMTLKKLAQFYTIVIVSERTAREHQFENWYEQGIQDMHDFLKKHSVPFDRFYDFTEGYISYTAWISQKSLMFMNNWQKMEEILISPQMVIDINKAKTMKIN
jgi:hypothetical protein